MPEQILNRVKAAVVLVRADQGSEPAIVGSGVLVHKTHDQGYIATNHHVVAGARGRQYSVVFRSGLPDELVADAFLVASDPDKDIAFLKVSSGNLPEPAKVNAVAPLRETLPVYAFGFPFGARLEARSGNPAPTVTAATISSLRRDDDGHVYRIQIAGDVHPGNSGGPLVTRNGDVVGLVVSAVLATQIGFAIPAAAIDDGLHGYVREVTVDLVSTGSGQAILNARASLVDPLARLQRIELLLAPAPEDGRYPRTPDGGWGSLQSATRHAFTIAGDVAHARIELTHEGSGSLRYAYQVATPGGAKQYSRPREVSVEFQLEPVEEPRPRQSTPGWLEETGAPPPSGGGHKEGQQPRSLVRSTEAVVDATARILDLPARHIVPSFAWSRNARHVFMVDVQAEQAVQLVEKWYQCTADPNSPGYSGLEA
ncbi:MAG: trypsin-like peptidase domain-containing protein, partial [Planctomycetes bacterium]|nr:trypsin-like peptidase domain-containing protein [Planctomycetota bacterium]